MYCTHVVLLFLSNDVLEPRHHLFGAQRAKPETSAARLQRRNDFRQVIADNAEARILGKLLDNCNMVTKLARLSHGVTNCALFLR